MFDDKLFKAALLTSFIIHGVILLQNSSLAIFSKNNKEQKVEVSYVKNPEKEKIYPKITTAKKQPLLKLPVKISAQKISLPSFVDKEKIAADFTKPALARAETILVKKKITLSVINNPEKINSVAYITHAQIVREKFKRALHQNYSGTETGQVSVSFIVSHDGGLQEAQILEEKSVPSPYLREIALRSIKEASPFPAFPKELDYPELSFNVDISFEIE